jgi:hypothetical protein
MIYLVSVSQCQKDTHTKPSADKINDVSITMNYPNHPGLGIQVVGSKLYPIYVVDT